MYSTEIVSQQFLFITKLIIVLCLHFNNNFNSLPLRYNKQHLIPLEEVKLQSLEDEGQYKNGWLICTQGKSFAVYAATATEKQEWMAHIDKVKSNYSAALFVLEN